MTGLREACWLLRCVGESASPELVARVRRLGYQVCLDQWLSQVATGAAWRGVKASSLLDWWLERMLRPRQFFLERMTLFWHGFFTSSSQSCWLTALLFRQNHLLRMGALGRFEDLLQSVSRDPAMLLYLDGYRNRKEHPNENFAREVMELFTVGPHFASEEELREAARAFTGWEIDWLQGAKFRANPKHHDPGQKRFRELRGALEGGQVLHRLASDPACAQHVCQRLWDFWVGSQPERGEIDRLAGIFLGSHGNLKVTLRSLFLGDAFRQQSVQRSSFTSGLEFALNLSRVIGQRTFWSPQELKQLGHLPFAPPSVAGWPTGTGWIHTGTLQNRFRWVSRALARKPPEPLSEYAGPGGWLALAHHPDASPALREKVEEALTSGQPGPRILALILCSPEAQLK